MNGHFEGLNRAAAKLRITQDQETVRLANAAMLAAAAIIEAHHSSRSQGPWIVRTLRGLVAGEQLGDPVAIQAARRALAEVVRTLVEHTRKQLDHQRVDLWELPTDSSMGERSASPSPMSADPH